VWIDRHDPDAVRRVRNTVRGRGVSVDDKNDKSGVTTIVMRLTAPGAALLVGRLRRMAKAVCANDPRTLDQRMADAAEALAADADHLQCQCGSDTCPAAADDGVASRFVVHIYGEAGVLDGQPDPLIHGDGTVPAGPDNVTVKPKKATAPEQAEAAPTEAEPAPEPEEPTLSGPRQCRATATPDQAETQADAPEGEAANDADESRGNDSAPTQTAEATSADTADDEPTPADTASAPPLFTSMRPPAGVIPGFGVVPNPLIAALIAGGAEVRPVKAPAIDPADGYRIRTADREFVQARDLLCRMPGCDRPIHETDLDHTIAWGDGGPTHGSNLKGYCRHHHLIKTFRDGWSDVQNPDGTIMITTPTGHTYISIPTSRLFFPAVNTTSAPVQRGSPRKQTAADKTVKMPKRKRSKAQDRAYRIAAERALNHAYLTEGETKHTDPPPL